MPTFLREEDYEVFISLFKRYLCGSLVSSATRHMYPSYQDRVELLAYALMPNHFHLFVYQYDAYAITDFMRSLLTSYGMYFNKTYDRVGPVFQSHYRAKLISDDAYLHHISRYIHLNPVDWKTSNKTSLDFYRGTRTGDWIKPDRILRLFENTHDYLQFIEDYQGQKQILDELKWELASIE